MGLPLSMLGLYSFRLRADMNHLLYSLFHQGVLNEQFLRLRQLQDANSPNFVSEIVNLYFNVSEESLRILRSSLVERELEVDYSKIGFHVSKLRGGSLDIGAKRISNVCLAFRLASQQNNRLRCCRALELLEHEYCYLKNKLYEFLQIEQRLVLAAGVRFEATTRIRNIKSAINRKLHVDGSENVTSSNHVPILAMTADV